MKIILLPGVFRQMATTVGMMAPIFFVILLSASQMIINDAWHFRLPIRAVLSVFMAIHFWWFITANDQDIKREQFLVSLPISRRQVARLGLHAMLASQSIVIAAVIFVCLILLALNQINLSQILIITIYCLWFTMFTLFTHCLLAYIKFYLVRLVIFMFSITIPLASLADLTNEGIHGGELIVAFSVPIVVAILSLMIIRHSERRFLQMDLV